MLRQQETKRDPLSKKFFQFSNPRVDLRSPDSFNSSLMDFNQLTEQQKTEPDELKMGQKSCCWRQLGTPLRNKFH